MTKSIFNSLANSDSSGFVIIKRPLSYLKLGSMRLGQRSLLVIYLQTVHAFMF